MYKVCTIENDGNLTCDDMPLALDIKGNRPTAGDIIIEDRKPVEVINMVMYDYILVMEPNKEMHVLGTTDK